MFPRHIPLHRSPSEERYPGKSGKDLCVEKAAGILVGEHWESECQERDGFLITARYTEGAAPASRKDLKHQTLSRLVGSLALPIKSILPPRLSRLLTARRFV